MALRLTPRQRTPKPCLPHTHSLAQPGHAPNVLQKMEMPRPSGHGPVLFITKREQDGQVRFLLSREPAIVHEPRGIFRSKL